jgi:beta-glucosidase
MRLNCDSFLWGVATSSYQTEGGITNNDWNLFTSSKQIKERVLKLTTPSIFYKGTKRIVLRSAYNAVRFWEPEYYEADFDNAKKLGLNAFRVSLEWSRIQPDEDQWEEQAIEYYKKMLLSMHKKGLNPILTLNHITLPLWILSPPISFKKKFGQILLPSPLKEMPFCDPIKTDLFWKSLRGWENGDTVEKFVKYVERMTLEFRDLVDYWITITEPVSSIIGGGYISGLWPPGFCLDGNRGKKVLRNLIEAHIKAYDTITRIDDIDADGDGVSKNVGLAHMMIEVKPDISKKIVGIPIGDNVESAKNFDYFVNDYFLNAIVNGEEDINYLNTLQRYNKASEHFVIHADWRNKIDFIGLNYYRRVYVYRNSLLNFTSARFIGGAIVNDLNTSKHPHNTLSDLGWEIYPSGIYNMIMRIKDKWNKPIFVTENGIADKDDKYRAPYIIAHIHQMKKAINAGANIIGYLHWSLVDNYEWQEGYKPEAKFGLYRVDHSNKNLNREITNGAIALKIIVEESLASSKQGIIADSAIIKASDKFGMFNDDGSIVKP